MIPPIKKVTKRETTKSSNAAMYCNAVVILSNIVDLLLLFN